MSILIYRRRHHTVPPFLVFSTQPGGASSGSAFSPQPVVTAKNPDGTTKTSFTGNVTLAVNTVSGSHSLGGTVTVAAVAGVATFSGVTDTGSGDGTLTATAAGYSSATSASFTTAAGGFTTITDTFTGANGTANAGRTTDTGSKTWVDLVGTFQLQGNQLAPLNTQAGDMASIDAGVSDFTMSLVVGAVVTAAALHFRTTDGSNHWRVSYDGADLNLYSVSVGTPTVRAGGTLTLNVGDTIAVVCSGTSITVKVNGTNAFAPITNAFNSTATKLGAYLNAGNASTRWDSLSVTVP